jgi:hypothetical protein
VGGSRDCDRDEDEHRERPEETVLSEHRRDPRETKKVDGRMKEKPIFLIEEKTADSEWDSLEKNAAATVPRGGVEAPDGEVLQHQERPERNARAEKERPEASLASPSTGESNETYTRERQELHVQ